MKVMKPNMENYTTIIKCRICDRPYMATMEMKKCKCGCHKIPRVGGGLKIKCVRCGSVYLGDNKGFIHLETKYEKQNR
jgi:hypothetical protein